MNDLVCFVSARPVRAAFCVVLSLITFRAEASAPSCVVAEEQSVTCHITYQTADGETNSSCS